MFFFRFLKYVFHFLIFWSYMKILTNFKEKICTRLSFIFPKILKLRPLRENKLKPKHKYKHTQTHKQTKKFKCILIYNKIKSCCDKIHQTE